MTFKMQMNLIERLCYRSRYVFHGVLKERSSRQREERQFGYRHTIKPNRCRPSQGGNISLEQHSILSAYVLGLATTHVETVVSLSLKNVDKH